MITVRAKDHVEWTANSRRREWRPRLRRCCCPRSSPVDHWDLSADCRSPTARAVSGRPAPVFWPRFSIRKAASSAGAGFDTGKGGVLGLLAGAVFGVVGSVVNSAFSLLTGGLDIESMREAIDANPMITDPEAAEQAIQMFESVGPMFFVLIIRAASGSSSASSSRPSAVSSAARLSRSKRRRSTPAADGRRTHRPWPPAATSSHHRPRLPRTTPNREE